MMNIMHITHDNGYLLTGHFNRKVQTLPISDHELTPMRAFWIL